MAVKYDKLLKALEDNGYNSYKIKTSGIIGTRTYYAIKNGLTKKDGSPCGIDLETLDRIAKTLNMNPWDLVEFEWVLDLFKLGTKNGYAL